MQKRSESVYSFVFWLISGLLVWLVIMAVACVYVPVMLLRGVGKVLFGMFQPNLVQSAQRSQTPLDNQSPSVIQPLLTSLLLTTVIEVPAFLAAVISLQPKRVMEGTQILTQRLEPLSETETDAVEVSAEERSSGT